jgi:hypothetical protein
MPLTGSYKLLSTSSDLMKVEMGPEGEKVFLAVDTLRDNMVVALTEEEIEELNSKGRLP